ncbi:pilus assembly protein PilM [Mycetohabitans sp. B2]|jgi:Tfp pilus assembly PilM family ATPase|uniref:pilus assembly protein PilM n=1 Tax=Mycetohabitans sp. B2 TaxID=2841274 RepID=UPI001F21DFA5|nr:pilus assembly protein PilM [Mycetohabitans sp. B2]MCF7695439.1 pilus assembly protein PilM [Mycetohabitans sp. B2]
MQNALLSVGRRFAAGIDITPSEIRMAVASRRLADGADVRVEHLAAQPLPAGVVEDAEILRPECVSRALSVLRDGIPIRRSLASVRYAMALPPAVTYTGVTSLAELARRTPGLASAQHACAAFDELEPAVLAEAERLFGVDPSSIVVDWLMADRDDDPDAVTITAASRDWLDIRIATAAAANIVLSTVDGEAAAALRACRLQGALVLPADCCWCAIWAGGGTVYAWLLRGTMVRREWHALPGHRGPILDALRDALASDDLSGAVVSGEVAAIAAAGLDFDALRGALGCDPQLFRCAPFCRALIAAQPCSNSPAYAVAFGLAMRGVLE